MRIAKSRTRWVMMAFLVTTMSLHAENWLPGWGFRKTITIDYHQIDAVLTNFPTLVRLTSENFNFGLCASDGSDIRFTNADGETLLSFERESHEATARSAAYWVKIPLVSASSNTTFYLYSGKGDATDGATPTAVWDATHVGVWHLNQTNGVSQADSTTTGKNLSVSPAGLDKGDVALPDCGSTTDWSVAGPSAALTVDTATVDTVASSPSSLKMAVTSVAVGQTNILTYNPTAPLVLGNRRLNFFIGVTGKSLAVANFSAMRVYLYDTQGNYRYHDLLKGMSTGNTRGYYIASGGTIGGTAPDVNDIDRIEWSMISSNTTPYNLFIDTLNANGAMEEGTSGAIGKGVTLSGNDHYLVTANQNINTTNGVSFSAWVRRHDKLIYSGSPNGIVSIGGGNWPPSYYQTVLGTFTDQKVAGSCSIYSGDGYPDAAGMSIIQSSPNRLTAGVWHHVAGVYNYDYATARSTMKIYVDGVQEIDQSVAGRALRPLLARPVFVGATTHNGYSLPTQEPAQNIRADLDEVRVSNVCRSEAWLKASYRNQKSDSALLSLSETEGNGNWLMGWKRRHCLTLNAAAVDADLTNFPVLVRLTSATFDFANADANGADIRFMSGDNKFFLSFEREAHDAVAQTATYWVRVPLVSASTDTTFYLYYGSKSAVADAAAPSAVWDAGHMGVWHLHQTNGVTQADSTAAGNTLAIGPVGLDQGDVAISDCDSTSDWSVTGVGASFAVDTLIRDTIGGSPSSIKLDVSSTAAGQTNALVYNPAAPLVLGNRRLDFFYTSSKHPRTEFTVSSVYIYDTQGNYRFHDFKGGSGTDRTKGYSIGSGGTTGGIDPDVNAIDRIEWVLVSANNTAYALYIDTLYANGALEEGASGAISKGVKLSGNDHYLLTSAQNINTTNGLTLSVWVRQRDYLNYVNRFYSSIVGIGGWNFSPYYLTMLGYYKEGKVTALTSVNKTLDPPYADGAECSGVGTGFTTGVWHHVAGVYHYDHAASNTTLKVYVDGVMRVSTNVAGRALRPFLNQRICVGAMTEYTYPSSDPIYQLNGELDELRVSNVARSEAWLNASFQNQKANDTLLSIGRVEPPVGSVILLR